VSPRHRAQHTLELLNLGCKDQYPWNSNASPSPRVRTNASISVTDAIREWDYGEYEGLTSSQIREKRPDWDIWRDGCEGGESPEDVTKRVDELIKEIREKWHKGRFGKEAGWKGKDGTGPNDVLIVAHGHILRSFAARWVGVDLRDNPSLILEAGGVGTLR
jgi:probable phosphoglycerate mutase